MREILFRGQTRRKGEKGGEPTESKWVYGGIFPTGSEDRAIIYQQAPEIKKYPVYADTVGQYTGLKDKNGVRIFEGDIVEYSGKPHKVVFENRFGTAYFGIVMDEQETWYFSHSVSAVKMKVIGNIYDNPELVEDNCVGETEEEL